jgi:hypothetical protein
MAVTEHKLKKHFKTNKYTTLETLLQQFINEDSVVISRVIVAKDGFYIFSHTAISMMQDHLKKNTDKSSNYNNFKIQTAMIKRSALYNDNYMIKVMYDRWLGDNASFACDYLREWFSIDTETLIVQYADGESNRE